MTISMSDPPHLPHDLLCRKIFRHDVMMAHLLPLLPTPPLELVGRLQDIQFLVPRHLRRDIPVKRLELDCGGLLQDLQGNRIYALVEFQSSPDHTMPFRMDRYMAAVEQEKRPAGSSPGTQTLPLDFLPVIFYVGGGPAPTLRSGRRVHDGDWRVQLLPYQGAHVLDIHTWTDYRTNNLVVLFVQAYQLYWSMRKVPDGPNKEHDRQALYRLGDEKIIPQLDRLKAPTTLYDAFATLFLVVLWDIMPDRLRAMLAGKTNITLQEWEDTRMSWDDIAAMIKESGVAEGIEQGIEIGGRQTTIRILADHMAHLYGGTYSRSDFVQRLENMAPDEFPATWDLTARHEAGEPPLEGMTRLTHPPG